MAYFTYTNMQAIHVHGEDCIRYLQGQLTNDLLKLNGVEPLQLNALCNQKGRVIALFFIRYLDKNAVVLMLPVSYADQILSTLRKYAVFSKISFDPTDRYGLMFKTDDAPEQALNWLYQHSIVNRELANELAKQENLQQVEVMKANICQQLPMIDVYNSEKFLPAELNLDQFHVIAYDKGCFMGQEIIARMKYRGSLKKALYSVEIDGKVDANDKLIDSEQQQVADIVNQVVIDDKTYVLGVFNKRFDVEKLLVGQDSIVKIIA